LRSHEISVLGRPPPAPTPLHIDDQNTDPWDRRFLGEAIDLGHTLDRYAATYTTTLGSTNERTVGFYTSVLPSLVNQAEFTADLLASTKHSTGEVVVGGAITGLSRRSTFAQRWRDVFTFKDAGASWGLVALDQGVASDPLLKEVQTALNQTPFQFALAGRTPPTAATTPVTGGAGPTTAPPTTSGGGGPTTTTAPPPSTTVVPPTGSPLVDGLVNNVNQLLGGLLGGQPPGT
jgi:hypothetical protein